MKAKKDFTTDIRRSYIKIFGYIIWKQCQPMPERGPQSSELQQCALVFWLSFSASMSPFWFVAVLTIPRYHDISSRSAGLTLADFRSCVSQSA